MGLKDLCIYQLNFELYKETNWRNGNITFVILDEQKIS